MVNYVEEEEAAMQRSNAVSDDFHRTFDTDEGKRVLEFIMRLGGVLPRPPCTDPNECLVREGAHWLANTILANLDVAPSRSRERRREAREARH